MTSDQLFGLMVLIGVPSAVILYCMYLNIKWWRERRD
jgi:hypothetical protein